MLDYRIIKVNLSAVLASVNVTADVEVSEDGQKSWAIVDALSLSAESSTEPDDVAKQVIVAALQIVELDLMIRRGLAELEAKLEGHILLSES